MIQLISSLLERAMTARRDIFKAPYDSAFRLFNGFTEGYPGLSIEIYGRTAVFHNYEKNPADEAAVNQALALVIAWLPWLQTALVKTRKSSSESERNGRVIFGQTPDTQIVEEGTRYAISLMLNRDSSLYLDTRELRRWLTANMRGLSVLNTFAYTCSLGVASMAGGANRVLNTDLSSRFFVVGRASYSANHYAIRKIDFIANDFWPYMTQLNRAHNRFDCVILDPPFFSVTNHGRVDTEQKFLRLINKVRPLVRDHGQLVVINNAVFVSGQAFMTELNMLCADGYMSITQLIDVPEDCTGYPGTLVGSPVTSPAPFNHATKIAILTISRK